MPFLVIPYFLLSLRTGCSKPVRIPLQDGYVYRTMQAAERFTQM